MMTRTAQRVIAYEVVGFGLIILLLWADEWLDIPHLLGAMATPANWVESAVESALVLILGVLVIWASWRFLKHIRYLEGFVPMCAFCKRVRLGDEWVPVEQYICQHSTAQVSHGFCPECAHKHYGEYLDEPPRE
ncbi:MAG: hypothetical protein KKA73_05025 [Chloroflexi bacterium]|nr:hypothetical protein [Chloroflexota bacterium]MBU1747030.1 hypothetical protein [Chloroflexota bacterium]